MRKCFGIIGSLKAGNLRKCKNITSSKYSLYCHNHRQQKWYWIITLFIIIVPTLLTYYSSIKTSKPDDLLDSASNIEINNLILKIYEKCENNNKSFLNNPAISSLVLHGNKAIPLIIDFISESINTDSSINSPTFLVNFRESVVNNESFICLIYSINKICKNDTSKEYIEYFNKIFFGNLENIRNIKKAILLAYILWNFNDNNEILELEKTILFDKKNKIPYPIKIIVLRSYLSNNKSYFSLQNIGDFKNKININTDILTKGTGTALEILHIKNWQILCKHIDAGIYNSFINIKNKDGVVIKSIEYQKIKYKFKKYINEYIYGIDFFGYIRNSQVVKSSQTQENRSFV